MSLLLQRCRLFSVLRPNIFGRVEWWWQRCHGRTQQNAGDPRLQAGKLPNLMRLDSLLTDGALYVWLTGFWVPTRSSSLLFKYLAFFQLLFPLVFALELIIATTVLRTLETHVSKRKTVKLHEAKQLARRRSTVHLILGPLAVHQIFTSSPACLRPSSPPT